MEGRWRAHIHQVEQKLLIGVYDASPTTVSAAIVGLTCKWSKFIQILTEILANKPDTLLSVWIVNFGKHFTLRQGHQWKQKHRLR